MWENHVISFESHRSTCHPRRIRIVVYRGRHKRVFLWIFQWKTLLRVIFQLLSATRSKPHVSYPVILSVTLETNINSFFTENIRSQQLKGQWSGRAHKMTRCHWSTLELPLVDPSSARDKIKREYTSAYIWHKRSWYKKEVTGGNNS